MSNVLVIDGDNVSPRFLPSILRYSAHDLNLKRVYLNRNTFTLDWFTNPLVKRAGLQIVEVPTHSPLKKSADIALTADLVRLCVRDNVDHVFLASSDSDFTPLCSLLLEEGVSTHLFGESKTPTNLRLVATTFNLLTETKSYANELQTAQLGLVLEVNSKRKHGFIEAGNIRYYFNGSNCRQAFEEIRAGAIVSFVPSVNHKGSIALEVAHVTETL